MALQSTSNVTRSKIIWDAPSDDTIAWFKVYKTTANDTALLATATPIATIPYTDKCEYTDIHDTLGPGGDRFYWLKSITYSDKSSGFSAVICANRTSGITISDLNLTGNLSVQGTAHICGAATFGSTIQVSGSATFSGGLNACGSLTISSEWRLIKNINKLYIEHYNTVTSSWKSVIYFN